MISGRVKEVRKKTMFVNKFRNNEFPKCITNMLKVRNSTYYSLQRNRIDYSLVKTYTNVMKKSIKLVKQLRGGENNYLEQSSTILQIGKFTALNFKKIDAFYQFIDKYIYFTIYFIF